MQKEDNVTYQPRTTFPSALLLNENPDPLTEYIKKQFPDLPLTTCKRYDEVSDAIGKAEPEIALAFKVGPAPFPREAFLTSPTIKWIQASGAGIDHWVPWEPGQVTITNASGIHGDLMAQYTAWAILNHQLGLPDYAEQQKRKEWKKVLHEPASGKTLWTVNVLRQYGGSNISWGLSESPLVFDDPASLDGIERDGVLAGLNLQEVADEAGVNRGLVYRYFGSRRELLRPRRVRHWEGNDGQALTAQRRFFA